MKIHKVLNKIKRTTIIPVQLKYSHRLIRKFNKDYSIYDVNHFFPSFNEKYRYFHHYFWNISPNWLKDHRKYFSKNRRAFGEDAFHSMWYFIFKEFLPKRVLEIGVYRGSTLSLFSLLSRKFNTPCEVHGISPFTSEGDSVSKYLKNIDYYNDVIKNFDFFKLTPPILHKGFSTDLKMVDFIKSKKWDLIFIDGNHDYNVVSHDFNLCSDQLNKGGIIVFDDASLYTNFEPPFYSSSGHPGPSKVVSEIDKNIFEEIITVGHNRVFRKLTD